MLIFVTGCSSSKTSIYNDLYEKIDTENKIVGTNHLVTTGMGDDSTKYIVVNMDGFTTDTIYVDDKGAIEYTYNVNALYGNAPSIVSYYTIGINKEKELYIRYSEDITLMPDEVCSIKKDNCSSETKANYINLVEQFRRLSIDIKDKKYGYEK